MMDSRLRAPTLPIISRHVDDAKPVQHLIVDHHDLVIRPAKLEEMVDLRHRVLRAGLPRETAIFAGDELATSRHFAAFDGERCVSCATFHRSQWQDEPAWQLRGMATDDGLRGKGVGRQLLGLAEQSLRQAEPTVRWMWANARVPAIRFYQSLGWEIASDQFEIPTAGPHRRISRRLFPK